MMHGQTKIKVAGVYDILFYGVLGTMHFSHTQMVEYGDEVQAT